MLSFRAFRVNGLLLFFWRFSICDRVFGSTFLFSFTFSSYRRVGTFFFFFFGEKHSTGTYFVGVFLEKNVYKLLIEI